jgi:hypothetical protein
MIKSYVKKNKWFDTKRNGLLFLSILLVVSTVAICFCIPLSTSDQLTKVAGSETQFEVNLAYAYIGKWTGNTSNTDSQGHQTSIVSLYPSAIVLNVTRLPGVKIMSCDAVLEVYNVEITADSGLFEKFAYVVGTNYSSSFTVTEAESLLSHMDQIVDKNIYRGGYEGTIKRNWTEGSSFLTNTFGSACIYSSHNSTIGLWKAGEPTTISVGINRIGYLTVSNDSVTVYKDTATKATIVSQLSNHQEGFLYNAIMPVSKLNGANLFAPEVQNRLSP